MRRRRGSGPGAFLPHPHGRGAPDQYPPRGDTARGGPAPLLHGLHPLFPQRGRCGGPGHPRLSAPAPIQQGGAGQGGAPGYFIRGAGDARIATARSPRAPISRPSRLGARAFATGRRGAASPNSSTPSTAPAWPRGAPSSRSWSSTSKPTARWSYPARCALIWAAWSAWSPSTTTAERTRAEEYGARSGQAAPPAGVRCVRSALCGPCRGLLCRLCAAPDAPAWVLPRRARPWP